MRRLRYLCVVLLLAGCDENRNKARLEPSSGSGSPPATATVGSSAGSIAELDYLDKECRRNIAKPGFFVLRSDYSAKSGRGPAFTYILREKPKSTEEIAKLMEKYEIEGAKWIGNGTYESLTAFDGDNGKVVFEKHSEDGWKNRDARPLSGHYYLRVIIPSTVATGNGGVRSYVAVGSKAAMNSQAVKDFATSDEGLRLASRYREGRGGTIAEIIDSDTGATIAFMPDPDEVRRYSGFPSGGSGASYRSGSGS